MKTMTITWDFTKYDEVCTLFENDEDARIDEIDIEIAAMDQTDESGEAVVIVDMTVEDNILQKWIRKNFYTVASDIEQSDKF